jgi:hypothetical protein
MVLRHGCGDVLNVHAATSLTVSVRYQKWCTFLYLSTVYGNVRINSKYLFIQQYIIKIIFVRTKQNITTRKFQMFLQRLPIHFWALRKKQLRGCFLHFRNFWNLWSPLCFFRSTKKWESLGVKSGLCGDVRDTPIKITVIWLQPAGSCGVLNLYYGNPMLLEKISGGFLLKAVV